MSSQFGSELNKMTEVDKLKGELYEVLRKLPLNELFKEKNNIHFYVNHTFNLYSTLNVHNKIKFCSAFNDVFKFQRGDCYLQCLEDRIHLVNYQNETIHIKDDSSNRKDLTLGLLKKILRSYEKYSQDLLKVNTFFENRDNLKLNSIINYVLDNSELTLDFGVNEKKITMAVNKTFDEFKIKVYEKNILYNNYIVLRSSRNLTSFHSDIFQLLNGLY